MKSKGDLILHPVRLRIIQALLPRPLTTRELAKVMPDVPPATLYRHLKLLVQGDVVSVVAESRVRGAIERTYAVSLRQTAISPEELGSLDRDGHMRLFLAFIASVIDGFERYIDRGHVDYAADGLSYSQATLYLSDVELGELRAESAAIAQRAMALGPGPGRRPMIFSSIVVPDVPPRAGDGSDRKGDPR
jgi:DNA-binding transcriptional ArsR family regulator